MRRRSSYQRSQSDETINKREWRWLLQQQRERDHEILKQKMIKEYELKREAIRNERKKSDRSHRSPSRNKDGIQHSPKLAMSEKLRTSRGKETLFRGPSTSSRPTEAELRQIKVDIHRNLSGAVNASRELQREIVNPDDVIVKRRKDEGVKPIFDREELKNFNISEGTEKQEIKTITFEKSRKKDNSRKRRSRSLSPRDISSSRRDRRDRSTHHQSQRRRSKSSDSSDDGRRRHRNRSEDRERPYSSSSHHRDRKSYSSRRPSSRNRSHSSDRRRESPGLGRLTRIESVRVRSRRSRERREDQRSSERYHSETRPAEVIYYPHYIEPTPYPVPYMGFPGPAIMPPMMSMRGPSLMRNRPSFGPRLPFPPRYMNPRLT